MMESLGIKNKGIKEAALRYLYLTKYMKLGGHKFSEGGKKLNE